MLRELGLNTINILELIVGFKNYIICLQKKMHLENISKMPYRLFINCINILYRHNDLECDTIWNSLYEHETELIYRHISYLYFSVLFKIDLDFDEIPLTDLCNIVLNLNLRDEYKEELSVYLSNKYKDLNTSNDYEGLFDEEYITNDDKNKLILLTLDKLTSGSLPNY